MVAIVCYYLGLSTPCRLQQVWQEAELRRFLDKIQHTVVLISAGCDPASQKSCSAAAVLVRVVMVCPRRINSFASEKA
jgi:hypothetical protein